MVIVLLLFIASRTAQAILIGAGGFDWLVQNGKIIVKAQVTGIGDKPPFEMIAFEAKVMEVLKSDGELIGNKLFIEAAFPLWPKDLGITFAEKQVVLLVLKRVNGKLGVVNNRGAILPAINSKIHHGNCSSITRKVFDELRAFLPQARNKFAKGLVLVHLSQLASNKDEKIFLPYMKSKNIWVRRAALASLLRINPTPERIQAAVEDFSNHLSEPSDDRLFWEMYTDVQWAARCGSWGMEKNMTSRAKAYLPIYRVLIDEVPSDYQRVHVAVSGLKNVGTRKDIKRLYSYLDHKKAWIRHDVFEGLGRILGMKIKRPLILGYQTPENLSPKVKAWENKTRSSIEKALANEGLLGK